MCSSNTTTWRNLHEAFKTCITQAPDRADILNIGGFSDAVFQVVAAFFSKDTGRFVATVDAIIL